MCVYYTHALTHMDIDRPKYINKKDFLFNDLKPIGTLKMKFVAPMPAQSRDIAQQPQQPVFATMAIMATMAIVWLLWSCSYATMATIATMYCDGYYGYYGYCGPIYLLGNIAQQP